MQHWFTDRTPHATPSDQFALHAVNALDRALAGCQSAAGVIYLSDRSVPYASAADTLAGATSAALALTLPTAMIIASRQHN